MDSSSAGTSGLVGCAAANALAGAKKRTKVVFLSPVEVANWDQIKENSKQNVIDENDLINYERMLKDDDSASITGAESRRRQSKRRGRPKGSRNGARKRPVDPSQPWLESSDSDEPNIGLEDELDDDEYFRRLEEEKMREDAEEVSRKRREMEARAAARAVAQGRKGCTKNDPFITHQFQTPVNSDSNLSCQSGNQLEFGHQNKKQKSYAALSGFREVSDSDDFSELDDKCANRDGDYPKSLDDIFEQNEEDYQEPTSPLRQSVLDMLPPSPVIPFNSEEYKSNIKCEPLNAASSNDLNAMRTILPSASFNDLHTQKMLEMDPIELRFRAPPLILPTSANDLVCPRKYVLDVLSIYEILRRYGSLLRLSPFRLEDFAASLISDENSSLLAEAHMVLLKALLREDEANGTAMCPVDCRDSVNMTFYLLDRFTWPYLLASYLSSIKSSEAAARLSAANTTTAASSIGGPTGSGGADIVLTAALFPPDLIPLNPDYPFVPIESRIAVLRGLTNLFLATGSVRGDILREGLMTHEDYCRVCHQSGEVLCCDGCTAVFHLHCLNPPLSSVPTTSWICPVCTKKRTPGVTDCLSEAEKNGIAHYQEPIGKDRAGRLYWYISRRLIIEPVDFSQREPALMGFHDGVVDNFWEMEYGHELMENDPEVKEEDGDGNTNDVDDKDSPNYSTDNNILMDATSKLSSSDSSQSASEVNTNKQETCRKYHCNPSISYANEPCVYYYSSIEQVMHIRELLSTEWEPWLCYRLDALLPRMHTEMAITQKLTENGLQQFCLLKPNHKAISLSCSDSNQSCNVNVTSNTVHVYSVLEVEQALFKKLSKIHGETSDCPNKRLAIAASSLPSMDVPVFPTLPKELPSFLDKRSDDFCTELIVADQNSCIIRSYDHVISRTIKETSDDVATYPPTILEPQELSTLHMMINSSNSPTTADEYLLAYRLSDEGNWRSWTNLYTAGVWTGEDSSTNNPLKDSLNGGLKRTPSGTRNSNPVNNNNNSGIDPDGIMTSDSVNVAMTRAQHMDEKERRRLLSNKFNLSEFTCDLWQYIDPVILASTYKTIIDMMGNPINELIKFPAFERIRFDCWPASPYQLLDLLRLTLCYMESKIPMAFFTPAWRSHRQNWIKDVLDSKSPSDLAFVLARLEASIRSVCFQRVWFNSLGHLTLERMTTSQREEDKRLRQFDRFSSTTGAGSVNLANLPTNLIRTKTPRPVRHTVWKTRGEEYRRLGGDGWMWLSATRGNAGQAAERALRIHPSISSVYQSEIAATSLVNRSLLGHRRGLQHGIGWGVCPEYLQDQIAVKPPKASECRGHVLHPITGIPLYLNPKRNPYIIPSDVLRNLNEQIKKSSLSQHIVDDTKKDNPETYLIDTVSNNEKVTSEHMDTSEKNECRPDFSSENSDISEITKVEERKGLLSGQTMSIKNTDHNNDDNMNPVLNVSYCISNRIHFPPCVEIISVDKTNHISSSSKRLHFRLDNLLQHRYIAAENDKKAGLAALSAVSKLEKEIESLEKRHTEVIQRLTTLSTDAQQARTAKAQAVKAKQNALLVKPSSLPLSGNIVTNSRLIQSNENSVNTPTIGKQLIQQSVLTDQGVRYRVLAPRTIPNMHMNQVAINPMHKAASTPSRTPTASRSAQRHRAARMSDPSESDSDSDPMPPGIRQGDSWSGRENVPLRRSARRIRAVRHDPDFIVDFDEDDDEDDRLSTKADDSDNFDPNDEIQGSSKRNTGQRRSQTAVHLNPKSTSVRGLPQYDGVGDTTDEDVDEYDDDILEEDEVVVDDEDVICDYDYIDDDYDDEAGEYYYDNDEIEDDEVVDDEEEEEVEDYLQVYSTKQLPTQMKLKMPEKSLKVSTVPYPTHSGKTDAVPVMPKVVILKNNNATPNIRGNNTHTNSSNPRILPNRSAPGQRIILPATMKLPPTSNGKSLPSVTTPSGNIKEDSQSINLPGQPFNIPQSLRLVRIVRNPDGGTNIVPVAASDTILPTYEPNINQTVDNSNTSNTSQSGPLSASVTRLNSLDGGIHLVLNSNTGLNTALTLSKPSVVSVESSELKPVITNTHFVSACVGNETSNITPPQPITITAADIPHSGLRLTDLNTSFTVASVPGLNHPTTVNIATVGKLKPPSANSVRFVIAPSSTGSFGSANLNQFPTITVVKASNPSDVSSDSSTVTSSVTSSLPPILPRKPPAILRRTLAGPPSTSLLLPISSSGDSSQVISQPSVRTPSVASLVATNTARQLVCGDLNRYIPTTLPFRPIISDSSKIVDIHQGRRSMAKAQHHIRNASLVDEDSSRFMMNNDSKVLISDYQGTVRQFGPTVRLQQTPVTDEATLALDRAVTEANAKLDSINAHIATVRSEAQELESQINSLKSELNKYQEIVNRGSPEISSPYLLSLRNNADFDLSNKSFVNRFLRSSHSINKKKAIISAKDHKVTTSDSHHMAILPQSLPYINSYSWPVPNSLMIKDQPTSEEKQNSVLIKSTLFRLNPHNLRHIILSAGRREVPGYDVEKKRLSQVNWLYPSSRPNFAECWRFRLSQIRTGRYKNKDNNISFGLDLANFALLLRTLWHCIRWDDILAEPDEDSRVLDSAGRPCFKKAVDIDDDDEEEDVGGGSSGRQDDISYSIRRIVEIQPLDRFWLQANYKVRITTTHPVRSYPSRRRKATSASVLLNRSRSGKGPSFQDSSGVDESASRRKGRRGGQRNPHGGKDPDYDPAIDEGWRVGIDCTNNSSRRQSRNNFRSGRGSLYDSEDDDGCDTELGAQHRFHSQRNEVSVEEKWMSEDAVFLWEIRVFMNSLLPPKSSYPPTDNTDLNSNSDNGNKYLISTRLASLPPDPNLNNDSTPTTITQDNPLTSSSNVEVCLEKDGFVYGSQSKRFLTNNSSRRSSLASALQSSRMSVNSRSRSDDHSVGSIPRPLSPNTLEAKARARSIAATNAARASVAARRARFERALLEQRVRSLKSQFCARKRLIFNWAKSLADVAVNEIKGAQQTTKADKSKNKNLLDGLEHSPIHHHHTTEKSIVRKGRPNVVSHVKSSSALGHKNKIGRPKSTDAYRKRIKQKNTSTFSSSSGDENKNLNFNPEEQNNELDWTPGRNFNDSNHSELLAHSRTPRRSALNHGFIKTSRNTATPTTTTKTSKAFQTTTTTPKSSDTRPSKNRLTMKLSLKRSNKLLIKDGGSTNSSCSTPSTSPGLGDYDRCREKPTGSSKINRLFTSKSKKYRHESSNSDASSDVTPSLKSPRGSGSSRGHTKTTIVSTERKGGQPKSSDKPDKNEMRIDTAENVMPDLNLPASSGVYCVCKTPYDALREYIGCDLCRDWFHFECVGLDPRDADKLGDSWHCPDCKQAELKANEMLYCVCRTPYEPTRVYIACDGCDEWYHPECVGLTSEQAVNHTDTYLCPSCCQLSQHTAITAAITAKSSVKSKKSKSSDSSKTTVDQPVVAKTIYETDLTSDRAEKLIHLIEEIKEHKMSWPFFHTPDPVKFPAAKSLDNAFNLPSVIINLKGKVYKTLGDFSFDMNRLFTKSRLIYPKDTPEFNCTEIIEALFIQKMKQFKEENL